MADSRISNSDTGGGLQTGRTKEKVFHTVTACVRCRQRKTRCDPALPRCEPCDRANAPCVYYDSSRSETVSRTYITSLQDTVRRLSAELKTLEVEEDQDADHEVMAKTGGLVKFNERDDSRFLGPSSGIAITRFVMEFARQNTTRKTIRDLVPIQQAEEIKQKFDSESAKPTSKVYPIIASVAAEKLPSRKIMDKVLHVYMVKAQYALPLLHEPTFRQQVEHLYSQGSDDPTINFQVNLVIAIGLQKIDTTWAGLADSYYLAALPHLSGAVAKMDVSTLQCFALIAQYSLLTSTRTAAYWVVGLAAKLCQELGLCDESTIENPMGGKHPNVLEIDMRRRLFWIITSMEYGLAHSLGRPSAFGVTVDNINVKFFELCDDSYITAEGLLPGRVPVMKKCISVHFLIMRLLQAQIRRTLYLKKRSTPKSENDPWFADMLVRIDNWVRSSPKNDEGSGLSKDWFQGRRNTMMIMMYRPSPQIPSPTLNAAQQCYDAAVFNIHLHKQQVEENLIDITWIFTQAICMALNTVLWTLSFPGIRQAHPIEEVVLHIQDAVKAIGLCAERWPGVTSALQLYGNLVQGCLRSYENDKQVRSPGASSLQDYGASTPQTGQSPVSTGVASYYGPQSPQSFASPQLLSAQAAYPTQNVNENFNNSNINGTGLFANHLTPQGASSYAASPPSALGHQTPYSSPGYDGQGQNYPFPSSHQLLPSLDAVTTAPSINPGFMAYSSNIPMDNQAWLASLGDVYNQYMGEPFGETAPYPAESLGEQDQLNLMATLEQTTFPEVSPVAGNAQAFYNAYLP